MEENLIKISEIADFSFCPASIYFSNLLGNLSTIYYHTEKQIKGRHIHKNIDQSKYSTSKDVITSLDVYSERYNIIGKIDIYHRDRKTLVERKRHINRIYDGNIFQLYAQKVCMEELGFEVNQLKIYSYHDNKTYDINMPEDDMVMWDKFLATLREMNTFDIGEFNQTNKEKCLNCIYEVNCDRSLL